MDAMASYRASGRSNTRQLAQLWQLPLLLLSFSLFGYAAYLFIDPQPGMTVDQKLDIARKYLDNERPKAALELLNKVLTGDKLDNDSQGRVHIMLAESLEMAQKEQKLNVAANFARIIEQTQLGLAMGVKGDFKIYKRMGESYEALNKPTQALDAYRRAMAMDPNKTLAIQRKVIDLELAQDDPSPAEGTIDEYLKNQSITNPEKAWAIGQKAQLMVDAGKFLEARQLLASALTLEVDTISMGMLNYQLGYCAFHLGDQAEAERYLRVARDQFQGRHPLDADACVYLGKICQDRNDPQQAIAFFEEVLVNHPEAKLAPIARLGRGVCRIMLKQDDAGLTDLHDLTDEIAAKESRLKFKDEAILGLRRASELLAQRENLTGALEVLGYEQQLDPDPSAGFYARLANVYEKRADQLQPLIEAGTPADRIKRDEQVRKLLTQAGDAYVAYSRKLTLADDKGYGEAMWKGIDLYDRAANDAGAVSALELFVAERPDDALTPDALLRLGRTYQAGGMFDKAIEAFQRNQFRYPQSLAASKSAVPLAQAYIAQGPDSFGKAEKVLLSVVNNNPLLTPESEEFKQALFELGQLFYRTERYEDAVGRLNEFVDRYPSDQRIGQLLFLMADSYRKSAGLLDAKLAAQKTASADASGDNIGVDIAESQAARKDRLTKAKVLYDRVVDLYKANPPSDDVAKLYQKLSHFYRADCLYDLGQYADAIQLYDTAAFRYQEDPSALAAYVQIVNAYCALGKMEEAKTANERAKWLLRRIPPESFNDGTFSMPKEYWEQWLKWTSEAGMW
jgi:tetratricopeptide (TPR) repeat protein